MITAIGTAVIASPLSGEGELVVDDDDVVSGEAVVVIETRDAVLKALASDSIAIEESTWQFLFERQMPQVASRVLAEWPIDLMYFPEGPGNKTKELIKRYFAGLTHDDASAALYQALSGDRWQLALELIGDLSLASLVRTLECLRNDDQQMGKRALRTLSSHQRWYSKSDLDVIDELTDLLSNSFPDRSTTRLNKPLLGSSYEQWVCECSQSNGLAQEYCVSCQRDRFGFHKSGMRLDESIKILNALRATLATLLTEENV
jgi:hypothetical protein